MGRRLRKFLHSLLPSSWVTKIKLSDGSPRKLLPFFRAGTTPMSKSVTTSLKSGSTYTASPSVGTSSYDGNSTGPIDQFTMTELEIEAPATPKAAIDDESSGLVTKSRRRKRKSECLEESSASSSSSSCEWCFKRARTAGKGETISAELPDCLCEVVGDSSAVVKYVEDPDQELWESMVEMIVGNELWESHNLECLLYCYLSLNEPLLHHTIERTFLRVLRDLDRTSSPLH